MPDVLSSLDQLRYWTLYPAAQAFIRSHQETAAREGMTESQMGGMQTLLANRERIENVRRFADVRVQRFRDAGRPDQQEFWAAFLKHFDAYRREAPRLLAGTSIPADEAARLVIAAFVCHLMAENRYRHKVPFPSESEVSDARKTHQ